MSNYSNCSSHSWPRISPGGSMRSIGCVEYQQCNNCLAMKISFSTDRMINKDEWTRVFDEQIIEPNFVNQ